jgi:dihydrofolate reductase
MRKVSLGMNVTFDGFVAGQNGEMDWLYPTMDGAQLAAIVEILRETDTVLMGRVNYEEMSASFPSQSDEMATLLNSREKVVFSKTLTSVDWSNARLATMDAAGEIAALKEQPGKGIAVTGGARFAQALSQLGLIDEYNVVVHPVALGSGMPLFAELARPIRMKLVGTRVYDTGSVGHTYVPVRG